MNTRYLKLSDGCVRDSILYIDAEGKQFFREWTPTLNLKGRVDHDDAIKLAESCTLVGGGWSLPEDPYELCSIVDYSRFEPTIDTEAFPDTKPGFYWTAKVVTPVSSDAWGVGFSYGSVNFFRRSGYGYVRAVRRIYVVNQELTK